MVIGTKGAVKILTTLLALSGCSGTKYTAPVSDLTQPPAYKISSHTVARGETLYSIAWRYNIDVEDLAAANSIRTPYTIYPGQKLSLNTRQASRKTTPIAKDKNTVTPRSKNQPTSPIKKPTQSVSNGPTPWVWPANGKVIAAFGGRQALSKGIDIAAKKGESVLAAGSGTVVYAGDGLRGYGQLLIIKHDSSYLSAYAHNSKLLVKEGESVKAGQKIAEIGSSGTDRDKLHFEIRRDGQPVDPIIYLPKR